MENRSVPNFRLTEIGGKSALGEAYLAGRLRQQALSGEFRPSRREDVERIGDLPAERRRAAIERGLA
ncbi:MAG: hypothetical protein ACREQJ_05160, partial [Candidatus Binatia bacterium]